MLGMCFIATTMFMKISLLFSSYKFQVASY
jgi:hypothetical protein